MTLQSFKYYLAMIVALMGGIIAVWYSDVRTALFNQDLLRTTTVEGDDFPLTLVDPIGQSFQLTAPPERIVSVTLGTDEILSDLVSVEQLVGVTYLVDEPSMSNIPAFYPSSIQRIYGEVEEILSLQPDLVFVAAYTRAETVRLLLNSNIPVVRLTRYDTFDDIAENILLVSKVVGNPQRGEKIVGQLLAREAAIQNKVLGLPRPRVLYYNLNGYSAGLDTRIDQTIEMAGGYNVLRDAGIAGNQKVSEEMAIGLEPDIILMSGAMPDETASPAKQLMKQVAWQQVPAVINQAVYDLDGAWVLSVSQFSWQGLEQVAHYLHHVPIEPESAHVGLKTQQASAAIHGMP